MPKPSFTQEEQIEHLAALWGISKHDARVKLRQVRQMDVDALVNGDRVYWDDFATIHVEIKPPVRKRLPGATATSLFPARVNVKLEESETLVEFLNEAFKSQLEHADTVFANG